jgi:hypothetical protein
MFMPGSLDSCLSTIEPFERKAEEKRDAEDEPGGSERAKDLPDVC